MFPNINRHFVGIALIMAGVPYGMYLNTFYPLVKWSPIIMLLSFLLTTNWRNLLSNRFPLLDKKIIGIIFFQLFFLTYELISSNFNSQDFSFSLFVIAISFSLMSLNGFSNFSSLPIHVFFMSAPLIILGTYVCLLGWVTGEIAYYMHQENENMVIEPFTVGSGALVNMLAALCMEKKSFTSKILYYTSLVLGCYILFMCSKRTPLFVFIICIVYFAYIKGFFRSIMKKISWVQFVLPILIVVIAYLTIPFVEKSIDYFIRNTYSGILNLWGYTSIKDETGSAYIRFESRIRAYETLKTTTPLSLLFGMGHNYIGQIDNPALQLLVEMGLIAAFMYLYFVFIVPIRIAFKKNNDNALLLSLLWAFYPVISILNSGSPYMWNKWVPVILLIIINENLYHKKKLCKWFKNKL